MYIFHLTHVHMNTVFRIADFARVPDQILRSPTRSGIALPIYSNTNLFFLKKKKKVPKFSEYIHQYGFAIPDPVGDRKICQPACRQSAIPKLLLDRKICQPACRQSATLKLLLAHGWTPALSSSDLAAVLLTTCPLPASWTWHLMS